MKPTFEQLCEDLEKAHKQIADLLAALERIRQDIQQARNYSGSILAGVVFQKIDDIARAAIDKAKSD